MSSPSQYTRHISLPSQVKTGRSPAAWWRAAVLLTLLLSVAACNQSPPQGITDIPCETLTANGMKDMVLKATTPAELAHQIIETFDVTPNDEDWEQTADGDIQQFHYSRWDVAQTGYAALITDDTVTYLVIAFEDYSMQPALGKVIECLGSPDHYFIRYDQAPDAFKPYYVMNFYYTSQGIYLRSIITAPRLQSSDDLTLLDQPATATSPIGSITWVAPGDVCELDWHATVPFGPYADPFGETVDKEEWWAARAEMYEHVQPWPGSIEQLRVTWLPPYMLPPTPTPTSPPLLPLIPQ